MEPKKRKVDQESRPFNDDWTIQYFFIENSGKCLCLICQETVAVRKVCNVKRHFETRHSQFQSLSEPMRIKEVERLRKNFTKQTSFFIKKTDDNVKTTWASYEAAKLIAKKMKPFTDGDFFKEILLKVVEIICPDKIDLFSEISLSPRTITRRIEYIAENTRNDLRSVLNQLEYFSIAIDETTDMKDTCQLAVFARGVTQNFNIVEEFIQLVPMKDTTTGEDIFKAVFKCFDDMNMQFSKLVGITTDGAPAMVGKNKGFVSLLQKHVGSETKLIKLHCIIHQDMLCAKSLCFEDIMTTVVKIVNFILARGLNHRQFQEFLKFIGSEYGDVVYFTNIRWLSCGNMLERVYNLREEISLFLQFKEQENSYFGDPYWVGKLAFLVDITKHMNNLNGNLQGKNKLVFDMYSHISAFEKKLGLWEIQLGCRNYSHFQNLKNHEQYLSTELAVNTINDLKKEFADRFNDFRIHEDILNLFGTPYEIDVNQVPAIYQLELIDLQCDKLLESCFRNESIVDFYKNYILPDQKYVNLAKNAKLIVSLFGGSTYTCEQLFSKMKYTKNVLRTRMCDDHLDDVLLLSSTNISIDLEKLSKTKPTKKSH